MADLPTPRHWADLRAARPLSEGALVAIPVTVDGIETRLSMAMDQPGHLHLLIPVQRGPVGQRPPDPPSGIGAVKYTVDLSNVPALGFDEAESIIKTANPGYAPCAFLSSNKIASAPEGQAVNQPLDLRCLSIAVMLSVSGWVYFPRSFA